MRASRATLRVALVVGLSAAWLAWSVGVALPVTVPFHDDFENVATGWYPTANGWHTWLSGVTAYVSNQVSHSPTRAFRLHSRAYSSRCDYLSLDAVPDRFGYQLSLYMDPVSGRAVRVGTAYLSRSYSAFDNYFTISNMDGRVGTIEFSGARDLPPVWVGEFLVGQWVTVGAVLDFHTGMADLWLGDELIATSVPLEPRRVADPVTGALTPNAFAVAEANWPGNGWGVIYIDDVDLSEPPPPTIPAVVDVQPDTLNRKSQGRWVTCYIELPPDYSVADIDVTSLRLNGTLPPAPKPVTIGDYDGDGVADLMVKFDRSGLSAMLAPGEQTVELTGCLTDGTSIEGSDQIKVLH